MRLTYFFAGALLLAAMSPAQALKGAPQEEEEQENKHVRYEKELLQRELDEKDRLFCDRKIGGERDKDNKTDYDQCHITRLFIADIIAEKDKGWPPSVNARAARYYTRSKEEFDLLTSKIPKMK